VLNVDRKSLLAPTRYDDAVVTEPYTELKAWIPRLRYSQQHRADLQQIPNMDVLFVDSAYR